MLWEGLSQETKDLTFLFPHYPLRLSHSFTDAHVPCNTLLQLVDCATTENVVAKVPKSGEGSPYYTIKQYFDMDIWMRKYVDFAQTYLNIF